MLCSRLQPVFYCLCICFPSIPLNSKLTPLPTCHFFHHSFLSFFCSLSHLCVVCVWRLSARRQLLTVVMARVNSVFFLLSFFHFNIIFPAISTLCFRFFWNDSGHFLGFRCPGDTVFLLFFFRVLRTCTCHLLLCPALFIEWQSKVIYNVFHSLTNAPDVRLGSLSSFHHPPSFSKSDNFLQSLYLHFVRFHLLSTSQALRLPP